LSKKRFPYTWLALAYALLILIVSSIPDLAPPELGFKFQDKLYHFLEYGVFSIFLFFTFHNSTRDFFRNNTHKISIIIGASYAIIDEIHQRFIPGRSADILDFLADFSGVVLIQLAFWIYYRKRHIDPR